MGTHLRVDGESHSMNTKRTGFFHVFQKSLHSYVLWTKVASVLEGQQGSTCILYNWLIWRFLANAFQRQIKDRIKI